MDPERWQRIKELLHSALERAPQERTAFVNDACAGDSSLRTEVEALISSHEQAGGFIESPAFELMAESLGESQSMVGSDLGPYRVTGRLGAGGMGEVYLAEDTRLGRKVALKVLLAAFTRDEERVRRFQQEARAASALNHPNIVTIYEIGEIDSRHFIVTEVIEGKTLRRHLSDAEIGIAEALEIAIQIVSALSAAHAAGIIHRDIKPDNVMIRVDGIVKVLDFGLAKLTELKSDEFQAATLIQTQEGMVMGTPHYMSPEQARGLPVDARTDIWSLGVVLYEVVGGRLPFEGATNSDVIASILGREPTTLARYAPEVPTELEWIVKKALRKERDERYQTAKELLSDLKSLKHRLEFEQELERSMASGQGSSAVARGSWHVSAEADRAGSQSQAQPSREVIDSLAVLPLANNSADPGMEYFSDGITESIISSLSQLSELRVMAWSTVSRYKDRQVDPRELGRNLGVHAVLTGRVVQASERLVIKIELVSAMDGSHLWGETYSCEPSDILGIEAEIARTISEKLLVRLTSEERKQLTKRYPDNVEAYHAYLKGRYFWNKRSEEGLKKGIEHFQHAIDEDPGYAAAFAGVSDCYTILVVRYGLASKEGIPKAKAAAMKALEIDETLAEAHTSLAHALLHNWEWDKAEREFKRAVELNPNDANAHNFYAEYLRAMGRAEQALKVTKKAQELDPLSLNHSTNVANELYFGRRYDQAIEQCQKTLEMDRNFFLAHYRLGQAYEQKGMFAEAIAAIQRAVELSPDNIEMLAALGRVLAVAGRREEARRIVVQLDAGMEHRHSWHFDIALIYAGLGEHDQAFECLEKGYAWHDGMMIHVNVEPGFDSLRSDPRFQELVRKMGLPPVETSRPPTLSSEKQRTETTKDQAARSSTHQPWWSRREAKVSLVLGIVLILAGGGYLLRQFPRETKRPTTLRNATFTQLTDQPGPEFFPSLSPDAKSLAYASRASGNWDIYLQRVGGRNPINLTKESAVDDTQATFSPDGDHIAFRSERNGGGIFLMGAAGESVIRISDFGYSPAWSPDGEQIFVGTEKIPQPSTRPSKSQLWSINVKTNERRLVSEGDALQPNCSPHGNRIAFWSRPSKIGQRDSIWTIPAYGGDAVAVTDSTTTDSNPVWSPDGKFLYFSSNRGGSVNIWRVAIDEQSGAVSGQPEAVTTIGAATSALQLSFAGDGRQLAYIAQEEIRNLRKISFDPSSGKVTSEPISITRGSMQLWFPDASPDGEWLTCYSMGNQRHIFIMRTDGSELRDLTDDTFRHFWPRWSPDGKRIAFSSRRSGNYELWIINRDGSGLQQLTRDHASPGAHYSPWSPDGTRIAYSIHAPRNECIIFEPGKSWSEQKLEYLSPLSDSSLSFEGWSWSSDGKKLAGVRHLPSGVHSGIGIYDLEARHYDWLTDFGDWPIWLNDNRRMLFVSQGKIFLFDTATRKYEPVLTVTDQDVDIGSPSLSPDDKTLYFTFVSAEADIWLMALD
jgi:serine/threonine protein kinase/Tol biopolymer transport system component/Tfp pilus assembly protein PilF